MIARQERHDGVALRPSEERSSIANDNIMMSVAADQRQREQKQRPTDQKGLQLVVLIQARPLKGLAAWRRKALP